MVHSPAGLPPSVPTGLGAILAGAFGSRSAAKCYRSGCSGSFATRPRSDALSLPLCGRLCPRTPAHDTRRNEHLLFSGPFLLLWFVCALGHSSERMRILPDGNFAIVDLAPPSFAGLGHSGP